MIRSKLFYLLIVLYCCLQGYFPVVQCDFRVVNKWTNELVFQTASDFVRTGCGTLTEKSYLIKSDPLDACDVPSTAPASSLLSRIVSYVLGVNQEREGYQWVLFAVEGGCDLKTKFRNAAAAGYSGIIVGTDERHEEIIHPGLLSEDDEEFIDVHLVHSIDIRVLSHRFNQTEELVMEPPGLSRCRMEYQRTWIRSQYVSLLIRTWKKIMDACWKCIQWSLLMLGKVAKGLKVVTPSVFYTRDTFSSIAISLGSLVISITIIMIVSIHNNAKKLMKYRSFQEKKASFTKPDTTPNKQQGSDSYKSPPTASPPPPRSNQERVVVDYTTRHRINLNISLLEPLTKAKVNIAYRDMALKYHPDKNVHLDEDQLSKITEEFRSKKKSRDVLLLYCKE